MDLKERTAAIIRRVRPQEKEVLAGEVLEVGPRGLATWMTVRGDERVSVEVRCDAHAPDIKRGDWVELEGRASLVAQDVPLGLHVVWSASSVRTLGVSPRYKRAKEFASERLGRLRPERPQLKPGDRVMKVWVVTGTEGKAWHDVAAAARDYFPWMSGRLHHYDCWNIRDAWKLKGTLDSLRDRVSSRDVVIVTRGGGDRIDLDVFEDPGVVDAIANLTEQCVTILAVGHADDHFMTSDVATETAQTPTAAVWLIARRTAKPRPEPVVVVPTHRRWRRRRTGTWLFLSLTLGIVLGWRLHGRFLESSAADVSAAVEPQPAAAAPAPTKQVKSTRERGAKQTAGGKAKEGAASGGR